MSQVVTSEHVARLEALESRVGSLENQPIWTGNKGQTATVYLSLRDLVKAIEAIPMPDSFTGDAELRQALRIAHCALALHRDLLVW